MLGTPPKWHPTAFGYQTTVGGIAVEYDLDLPPGAVIDFVSIRSWYGGQSCASGRLLMIDGVPVIGYYNTVNPLTKGSLNLTGSHKIVCVMVENGICTNDWMTIQMGGHGVNPFGIPSSC